MVFGQTRATLSSTRRATIWDATGIHFIDGFKGLDCVAQDVNAHGILIGSYLDRTIPGRVSNGGFIGEGGTARRFDFPGFPEARPREINDEGWFTGVWEAPGPRLRGFVARVDLDTGQQEIRDLGLFPGSDQTLASAINNDGTIVGGAVGGPFGDVIRALIWPAGATEPMDLNAFVDIPGVTLIHAYRINNAGQILAEGLSDTGNYAYYVLTPVPEPAAVALTAALAIGVRHRGSRRPDR